MDHLIANLTKDIANVLTGKVLKVGSSTIQPAPKPDGTIAAQDLEAKSNDPSAYDLSGRYWIRGKQLIFAFLMKRGDGATLAWQGKIQIADFKDWSFARPIRPLPPNRHRKAHSPSSSHPPRAVRRSIGLAMNSRCILRVGQEASVYCFYVDSKGGVLTVLPNRFSGNDPNANRFAAKALHYLPDPSRDKFTFKFTTDTTGEELVDCFASTRDVRADLPKELFPDQIAPVPFLTLAQLRKLFANLKDTRVSEASVTVTVAR